MDSIGFAIVSPDEPAISETFIQAHLDELKPKCFYYGGHIPLLCNEQRLQTFFLRGIRRMIGEVLRRPNWHDQIVFEKSLRKEKIKVILAEYGTMGAHLVPSCKVLNVKLIVHFHGFDASSDSVLRNLKSQYEEMFSYATKVIVVSEDMKQDLIEIGCPEQKIISNPYGPNVSFQEVEPDYSSQQIIAVGRFVDKKAPYYIILAFKEVLHSNPEAKLAFVGEGPLLGVCENLVRYYGIDDSVKFLGRRIPNDIRKLFGQSSIFVQHSVRAHGGDKEGSPVAIMEAAMSGLPIVSTLHAGIKETVIDEKTGYLVDEHDVSAFSEKLTLLLSSEKMRKKMGAAGKEHITLNYSMKKHISQLKEIIETAIHE